MKQRELADPVPGLKRRGAHHSACARTCRENDAKARHLRSARGGQAATAEGECESIEPHAGTSQADLAQGARRTAGGVDRVHVGHGPVRVGAARAAWATRCLADKAAERSVRLGELREDLGRLQFLTRDR